MATPPLVGSGIHPVPHNSNRTQTDGIRRINARPLDLAPTSQGIAGNASSITSLASQHPSQSANNPSRIRGFFVWVRKRCQTLPSVELPGQQQAAAGGSKSDEEPLPSTSRMEEIPGPKPSIGAAAEAASRRYSIRPGFVEPAEAVGSRDPASLWANSSAVRGVTTGRLSHPILGISGSEEFDATAHGPYPMRQPRISVHVGAGDAEPEGTEAPSRASARAPDSQQTFVDHQHANGQMIEATAAAGDSSAVSADDALSQEFVSRAFAAAQRYQQTHQFNGSGVYLSQPSDVGTDGEAEPEGTGAPSRASARTPDSDTVYRPYELHLDGNTYVLPYGGDATAVLADSPQPPPPPAEGSATEQQALQLGNSSDQAADTAAPQEGAGAASQQPESDIYSV